MINLSESLKTPWVTRSVRLILVVISVLLAILYDIFFWDKLTGLSFPLFILIYLISFIIVCIVCGQVRKKWAFWLLIPILILSFDFILYKNGLVRFVVPIMILILLGLFSIILTLRNPEKYPFSFARIPVLRNIALPLSLFPYIWRDLFRWEKLDLRIATWKKITFGIAISIPLLIIFGILFSKADQLFGLMIKNLFDFEVKGTTIWRIVRTVIFTFVVSGFFYFLLSKRHVLDYKDKKIKKFDQIVTLIVLALVNVIFLVFVVIQINYLFGGQSLITEYGFTYAEYARKGFFELVWVVVLVALMMLIIFRSFAKHGTPKVIAILQSLLIVQTVVIAISALKRMLLYQEVFGYTVLRLYVEWFIYFLLILFLFSLISIWVKLSFKKFFYTGLVLGIIAFTVVSSINVHRAIARENIERYLVERQLQTQNELDTSYLNLHLSMDILPELIPLKDIDDENIQDFLKSKISREKINIDRIDAWQEFHLGAWQSKKTIELFGYDYYRSIDEMLYEGSQEEREEYLEQENNSFNEKKDLFQREVDVGNIVLVNGCIFEEFDPVIYSKNTACTKVLNIGSNLYPEAWIVLDEIDTTKINNKDKSWELRSFVLDTQKDDWFLFHDIDISYARYYDNIYLTEDGKLFRFSEKGSTIEKGDLNFSPQTRKFIYWKYW